MQVFELVAVRAAGLVSEQVVEQLAIQIAEVVSEQLAELAE